MTDLNDQEHEALKELVRLQGHGGLTYPCCDRAWSAAWEKAEAALAAREGTERPDGHRESKLEDLVRRASVFVNAVLVMASDKGPSLEWIADAAVVVEATEQEHER